MDVYYITLTGPNVVTKNEILKSESKQFVESAIRGGMASKTGMYYGYTKVEIKTSGMGNSAWENIPEIIEISVDLDKTKISAKVKDANIKQLKLWIAGNRTKIENIEKLISLQIDDINRISNDVKCTKKIVEQEKSGHQYGNHYTCLVCDKVHIREIKK